MKKELIKTTGYLENGVEIKTMKQVSVGDTIYFDMYKVGK